MYHHNKMKRLTTEQFIEKANKLHTDTYDYSQTNFSQIRDKIDVICQIHGKFSILAASHIHTNKPQGCKKCGIERRIAKRSLSTSDYIKRIPDNYKLQYDYSKVEYINSYTKVRIICKKHGDFFQLPFNHLNGQNCPQCGVESRHGFTKARYIEHCKKKGVKASLYFIEVKSEFENFIKIGLTSTPLRKRFANLPYTYIVLDTVNGEPELIWETENYLHRELQIYQYKPSIYFKGHTECFKIEYLEQIQFKWNQKINYLC